MKRSASRPFFRWLMVPFFVCLFSSSQLVNACGVYYPSDYFQVFFLESNLLQDEEYKSYYYPWYYNYQESMAFADWNDRPNAEKDFNTANIEDWNQYFGGSISNEALVEGIYKVDLEHFQRMNTAREAGRQASLPDSVSGNALLQYLNKGKDDAALEYLLFAKECEGWSILDRWWDTPERDADQMAGKIEEGKALREACESQILKDRYAFQLIRLAHYSRKFGLAATLYDEFFGESWSTEKGSNLIRNRSLLLKAGALKWQKNFGESMYLFAKVFKESPALRKSADHDFGFISMMHFSEAESFAQNDDERAYLWAMRGFQTDYPDLEPLRNLASLDSDQKLLEVLLIRQLNLLEAEVMSPRLTKNVEIDMDQFKKHSFASPESGDLDFSFDPGQVPSYEDERGFWQSIGDFFRGIWRWITGLFSVGNDQNPLYEPEAYRDEEIAEEDLNQDELLRAYADFTKDIARSKGTEHPDLWYLAAGYIEFMRGQYGSAEGLFKNAKNQSKSGSGIEKQVKLLRALNEITDDGKITSAKEKDLLTSMQWLEEMQGEHKNNRIMNRCLTEIGQNYLENGETLKGILCFARADDELSFNILCDVYAEIQDLETLRDKIESGPNGPWEEFLLKDFPLGRHEMQDLIGTRYLRKAKFEDAYREFKALPEAYWTTKREDPDWKTYSWVESTTEPPSWAYFDEFKTFRTTFSYYNYANPPAIDEGTEEPAPEQVEFSKLSFLEKVIDLEKRAKENPDQAFQSYMEIGKGFERTPFWGYSGVLWKGDLAWQWQFYYSANQYPFNIPGFSTELYIREHQFLIEYGSQEIAQLYYKKAMEVAPDDEQGALACFEGLQCEGDFNTSMHGYHNWATDNSWHETFQDRYKNTAQYGMILRTCPMLQAYLNRAVN